MNFLEERIKKDGIVKEGNVLKVDSFLNHQMDIELFDQMGAEYKKRFADKPINKILTIELPESVSPVSQRSISMFRLYLQRSHRALT